MCSVSRLCRGLTRDLQNGGQGFELIERLARRRIEMPQQGLQSCMIAGYVRPAWRVEKIF
jgi:hypothetical protein